MTVSHECKYIQNLPHLEVHNLPFNLIALKARHEGSICDYKNQIAYTIHTSGTTRKGQGGKQVHVPVKSFINNIDGILERLEISQHQRFISLAEPTFDVSLVEVYTALFTGGALVIPSEGTTKLPLRLFSLIKAQKVEIVMMTPWLFMSLKDEHIASILSGLTSVCHIVLGGECFPARLLLFPNRKVQLWNIYGTTECSVWATLHKIDMDQSVGPVFVGKPLGATLVEIRDQILWIGGCQRICYLDDETEPLLMRSTGDIAKEDQDGNIFIVGRETDQIKRFGQRVHLSEIGSIIDSLPYVSACV
jgi:non-ribosomal peptide synthetase component F